MYLCLRESDGAPSDGPGLETEALLTWPLPLPLIPPVEPVRTKSVHVLIKFRV